jgi:hypothetical protein
MFGETHHHAEPLLHSVLHALHVCSANVKCVMWCNLQLYTPCLFFPSRCSYPLVTITYPSDMDTMESRDRTIQARHRPPLSSLAMVTVMIRAGFSGVETQNEEPCGTSNTTIRRRHDTFCGSEGNRMNYVTGWIPPNYVQLFISFILLKKLILLECSSSKLFVVKVRIADHSDRTV